MRKDEVEEITNAVRVVVVGAVTVWAVYSGIGWLIAWRLCGCTP